MTTRIIAGHELTLQPGRRYLAGRPPAERGRECYPVRILDITNGIRPDAHPAAMVECLTYDQANELLRAFNGSDSFQGRIWE